MENNGMNVIDSITTLFQGLKTNGMDLGKLDEESTGSLKRLSDFYKTTDRETAVLCAAIEAHYGKRRSQTIGFKDLAGLLECDALRLVKYKNEIKSLIDRHYLKRVFCEDDEMCFQVSEPILDTLYKEEFDGKVEPESGMERYSFIRNMKEIYENREISSKYRKYIAISEMEDEYSDVDFVRKVRDLMADPIDRFIFYDCCSDFLCGNLSNLMTTISDILYDNYAKPRIKKIADGDDVLVRNELIRVIPEESIANSSMTLTEKAKELFLEEDKVIFERKMCKRDMIDSASIKEIQLFYSENNRRQIEELEKYLSKEHFADIRQNLKDKGMKAGFTILLHGAPGTGKTESVYQIARKTNRCIVKVDVSKSKSMWFGESEKKIKEIFDNYRSTCISAARSGENTPILLFNEADAIFSKRKDVSYSSTSQTENAIQNIILDEMENLEGILIATTNMTDNFDKAFERRFLYKICFENPTDEARASIWKSRMSTLTDECVQRLSHHELSGGQIDNVIRKATMDEVLTGQSASFEKLEELCAGENAANASSRKIGFCI